MRCGAPGRLVLAFVAGDPRHDIDAPTEIGAVRSVVWTARELFPGACLGIVDVVRPGQDVETDDVADNGGVARFRHLADISPPGDHRADARQELLEAGGVRIGVELIGRLGRQCIDDVLNGANPGRIVDARLHRVDVEQPGLVVRMLRVSRGAAAEEIETEPTPGLWRIEVAERVLALDFLALEELGHGLDLLPGFRHAPFARVSRVLPGLGQTGIGEIVGPAVPTPGPCRTHPPRTARPFQGCRSRPCRWRSLVAVAGCSRPGQGRSRRFSRPYRPPTVSESRGKAGCAGSGC